MYDVIIIGGGTAGCSCAWNCGKLGLKTLLLEKNNYLGGTMTGGLVVPVMQSGENQINTDFYSELITEMSKSGNQITYQDNPGWFNPIYLKYCLEKMLKDVGIDIIYNFNLKNIKNKNFYVESIEVNNDKLLSAYNAPISTDNIKPQNPNILSVYIEAKYFVDSTGDLNFCQKNNCEFLENKNDYPPVSLRFIMSGVNLDKLAQQLLEIDSDRDVTTVEYIGGQTHLSTAYTWDTDKHWGLAPLFDDAVSKGILHDKDRNYFQIFSVAGMPDSIAFNCPRIIENINPLDQNDIDKAKVFGINAIERLANFCKIYFKGFDNAYVSYIADSIGIRSSRRIKGKYIYTIDDLRNGKTFKNPVVISNYPVDVHSREKNTSVLEKNGEYQLPIESLMDSKYANLYIAGRGLSADEQAQGALRVQASCFSMGEAVAKDIYKKINNPVQS